MNKFAANRRATRRSRLWRLTAWIPALVVAAIEACGPHRPAVSVGAMATTTQAAPGQAGTVAGAGIGRLVLTDRADLDAACAEAVKPEKRRTSTQPWGFYFIAVANCPAARSSVR